MISPELARRETREWLEETVLAQAEHLNDLRVLHESICCEFPEYPRWTCSRALKRERDWCPKCRLGRALGVTE